MVEGTFGPIEVLKGWRQAEVIQYTTDCFDVGYTTAMFVVMNRNKWNAFPEDIRKIITEVSREWIDVHGAVWDQIDMEGRKYTLSLSNEIIQLPEEENKRWTEAIEPVINDYMKSAQEKGLDGEKAVAAVRRLIKKYSAVYQK